MTSERADTWMPFYMGDFEASTSSLSDAEKWQYFKVIFEYWRLGHKGEKIKFDEKSIKIIAKISSKKAAKILSFFTNRDGYLFHARIEKEITKAIETKEKNNNRTAAATAARWGKKTSVTDTVTDNVTTSAMDSPPPPPYSVTNVTAETPSKKKYYFDKWIEKANAAGLDKESARSFLGRQIKDFGELKVFTALDTLGEREVVDPKSYLLELLRIAPEPQPPRLQGRDLLIQQVGLANWRRQRKMSIDPHDLRRLEKWESENGPVTWNDFLDWEKQQ